MVPCSDQCVCIGVSIWTLLQTGLHIWWIVAGRKLFATDFRIHQKVQLYFYLTYFYNDARDIEPIEDYLKSRNFTGLLQNERNETLLDVLHLANADLTDKLMLLYFIFDALWIITSVSLLIGTLMRMKQWSAVFFFSPWIIIDFISLIMDVFCAIYFSLQVPKMIRHNLGEEEDTSVKEMESTFELSTAVIMAIMSGRLGVIWLINLVLLFVVGRATYRASKKRYADEMRRRKRKNNSEARIRNWQLFYGPFEDARSELNYSNTFKELEECNRSTGSRTAGDDFCSTFKSSPCNGDKARLNSELRGQLPWSYLEDIGDKTKKLQSNVQTAARETHF